jgi:hypothetical protein
MSYQSGLVVMMEIVSLTCVLCSGHVTMTEAELIEKLLPLVDKEKASHG